MNKKGTVRFGLICAASILLVRVATAQGPAILMNPQVDFITEGSARLIWKASVASSGSRIRWGTAPGQYPNQRPVGGTGSKVITGTLAGLPSDTEIYAVACTTANSSEACSSEVQFRTLTPQVVRAELPRAQVNTKRPEITGASHVIGADCDDPATGLIAKWNAANWGDEIVLPATTRCEGRWVFRGKSNWSPGKWIVIRGEREGRLPEGYRVTPDFAPRMSTVVHANPVVGATSSLDQTGCDLGRVIWNPSDSRTLKLWRCTLDYPIDVVAVSNAADVELTLALPHGLGTGDRVLVESVGGISQANADYEAVVVDSTKITLRGNGGWPQIKRNGSWSGGGRVRKHIWQALPFETGPSLPGSCAVGNWFVVDGTMPIQDGQMSNDVRHRAFHCTETDRWQRVYLDNHGGNLNNGAVFDFWDGGPNGIWLEGIHFTTITVPMTEEITKGFCCREGSQSALNMFPRFVATGGKLTVYEQNIFRPAEFARMNYAVQLQGAGAFFVNNWVENVTQWKPAMIGVGGDPSVTAVELGSGTGGPILIDNNYFSTVGIAALFTTDDAASAMPPSRRAHDLTITRNEFVWPERFRVGSPEHEASDAKLMAIGRHHIEFKDCRRCLIEGNIFRNSWASVNQGAAIALSSRTGGSTPNYAALQCTAGSCWAAYGFGFREVGEKLVIGDEIVTVTATEGWDRFTVTPPIDAPSGSGMWNISEPVGVYDVTIRNNKFENVTMPFYAISPPVPYNTTLPFGPFVFENNLVGIRPGFCGVIMVDANQSYQGVSCSASCANNQECWGRGWITANAARDWIVEHNTFYGSPNYSTMNYSKEDLTDGGLRWNFVFRDNIVPSAHLGPQSTIFGDTANWALGMLELHHPHGRWNVTGNVWLDNQDPPTAPPMGPFPSGNTVHRLDQSPFPWDERFRVVATYNRGSICNGSPCSVSGRDVGADILEMESAQANILTAEILENSEGSAKLRFVVSNGEGCYLSWGEQPNATGTQIFSPAGSPDRVAEMGALTTGTLYHWRLNCRSQQRKGSFTAN